MPGPNSPQYLRNKMLGVILKDVRETSHQTVREAAESIGMTSSMLSAFETGRRSITLPELEALAYTYDVPIRHFLYNAQFLSQDTREKIDLGRLVFIRQKMIATKLRQMEVGSFLEYHGPVGEWELNRESDDQFQKLPSDIRRFAGQPTHEPYLRLAMKMSELPAGRLRDIAEALLDITL